MHEGFCERSIKKLEHQGCKHFFFFNVLRFFTLSQNNLPVESACGVWTVSRSSPDIHEFPQKQTVSCCRTNVCLSLWTGSPGSPGSSLHVGVPVISQSQRLQPVVHLSSLWPLWLFAGKKKRDKSFVRGCFQGCASNSVLIAFTLNDTVTFKVPLYFTCCLFSQLFSSATEGSTGTMNWLNLLLNMLSVLRWLCYEMVRYKVNCTVQRTAHNTTVWN